MYRSRKTSQSYKRDLTQSLPNEDQQHCPFCTLDDRKVYSDGPTMRVMTNKFPYEYWDYRNVTEHLLLAPKRHVLSLAELTNDEKIEAINLMSEYEAAGYSVYWRSQTNMSRTVPHQHTHLFKLGDKQTNLLLYIRRPYVLWNMWRISKRP